MVVGHHKGEVLGACTDCRRLWAKYRAGEIDDVEIEAVNGRLAPSVGTCMVMGTASTMACVTEALGLSLPMSATIPAPHAERFRLAEASGKVAAAMAKAKGPKPSELLTAVLVPQCAGGDAGDRRLDQRPDPSDRDRQSHREHRIDLEAFDKLGREVPVLVDLKPSGEHYMEHFHHAGGVPKLMAQLGDLLDLDAKTIDGKTLRDVVAGAEEVPGPGRHSLDKQQSDQAGRLDGRAARQSRAARRRHQAFGGERRNCCSTPAARWCSSPSKT